MNTSRDVAAKAETIKPKDIPLSRTGALFGSVGYASGAGITQLSPLKYTIRGNAHPCLKVNVCEFFWSSISDWTFPIDPSSISKDGHSQPPYLDDHNELDYFLSIKKIWTLIYSIKLTGM